MHENLHESLIQSCRRLGSEHFLFAPGRAVFRWRRVFEELLCIYSLSRKAYSLSFGAMKTALQPFLKCFLLEQWQPLEQVFQL